MPRLDPHLEDNEKNQSYSIKCFQTVSTTIRQTTPTRVKSTSLLILKYLESCGCSSLIEYYDRIMSLFNDRLSKRQCPISITCAWRLNENPVPFNHKMNQYFVIAEVIPLRSPVSMAFWRIESTRSRFKNLR